MKILHFADLHLGVESYGRPDPATGLNTRLGDFLAALDEVVDYALGEGIDLVLFCGDAYKSREPTQTQQREFAKRIGRLAKGGISVFLLVGNHDLPNALARATTVEIFDTLAIENVHIAPRPGTYNIATKGGPLQIVALPWVTPSHLLTKEEYKNLPLEKVNRAIEEKLGESLRAEVASLDPNLPAVLAGHLCHSLAVPGSERGMTLSRDYSLLKSTLAHPAFDYIALGHIHKRQVSDYPVPMVYPGSLQRVDFGDEGEEKGFYVLELDGKKRGGERLLAWEFHSVKTRPFLTIRIDADVEDPAARVIRELAKYDVKDAIVRLQIQISRARQGLLQDSEVKRALQEAHWVTISFEDVGNESRTRLGGLVPETLAPLELLRHYLETKKVSLQRREQLLEYGARLIQQSSKEE
ncbi:MAG: exonuclease SbcCD subunit D [Chloroflexi bacterium]|nr:exonuclease SbcCD subunit D [Chloroflexota bacterium]